MVDKEEASEDVGAAVVTTVGEAEVEEAMAVVEEVMVVEEEAMAAELEATTEEEATILIIRKIKLLRSKLEIEMHIYYLNF